MNEANKENVQRISISKRLTSFGDPNKFVRIADMTIDSGITYAFGTIKDEIVLRKTQGGGKTIKVKFVEDNNGIFLVNIQGYSDATDKPHNASFSFIGDEITDLIKFIINVQKLKISTSRAITIGNNDLAPEKTDRNKVQDIIIDNPEFIKEILKSELTKEDIISIGYRKKQLSVFLNLLSDFKYFEEVKTKLNSTNEGLWQKFFEKNQWIFGYGLSYLFLSNLNEKKLEQVVKGYTFCDFGKRVDALMKTRGLISNLCFIEIKTHLTKLLEENSYRKGCWAPSKELSGAIAQIQGTVYSTVENLTAKISIEDSEGYPTGEDIYNYQAKAFLIIGSLNEFISDSGVNKDKLRSFELYRKNLHNVEIITFDELYERAKFIIHNNEQ